MNALADLLATLLANAGEEKPRLNPNLSKAKIAEDIQFVMKALRNGNT